MARESTEIGRAEAITGALLDIVARHGLDRVSVREVAAGAGVSIGTVQHYFPTKDAMLAAAYEEVVRRLRSRIQAVPTGGDVRRNLSAVLTELLPIDERRTVETRIHLAFAARAATTPAMAQIQQAALTEIHRGLREAFAAAWGQGATDDDVELAAHAAIAITDGLALHAVSSGRWLSRRRQLETLELALDAILGKR